MGNVPKAATAAQTPHLPPPPLGEAYRVRFIDGQAYCTTGTFPESAPSAELPHLAGIPAIILDCDLADYLLAPRPINERTKQATEAVKAKLHSLPDTDLDALINELAAYALQWCRSLVGTGPTFAIASGYGVHFYFHLATPARGFSIPAARAYNATLVERINGAVGFTLADPQSKDCGTRILRIPGTNNKKNPNLPRKVRILWAEPEARITLPPMPAAPAPFPSAPPPPAPKQPAPPGTVDPFATVFEANEEKAKLLVNQMMNECPFFVWAIDNPTKLSRESWRGAALNIAALAGEVGRKAFHVFSSLDPDRYDPAVTDRLYTDSLKSAASHGPMTYQKLLSNGDWGGTPPENVKAPAALRYSAKHTTAPGVVTDKHGKPLKTQGNLRKILRHHKDFGGGTLKFNEMKAGIEWEGMPITDAFFGQVLEQIEDETGVSFGRGAVFECVKDIAFERSYHPVKAYLQGLKWDGQSRLDMLLVDVLGVEPNALHKAFITGFLVSAVARVLGSDPNGVKVDSCLVLKGEQGIRKSSFFRELACGFFTDTPIDLRNKDAFLALRAAWIVEWGEFEHTLAKNEIAAVKAFLTSQVDSYRPPFGREQVTIPRRCVIVGTTNEDHFLFDPTGSRRFWIIDCPGNIDIAALRSIRDQLWAEAVSLCQSGAQHWLDSAMEQQRAEVASAYQIEEPWFKLVNDWIGAQDNVAIEDILREVIQKEPKDWKRADYQAIGAILRTLGFHRYRIALNNKRAYRYAKRGAGVAAVDAGTLPEYPNPAPPGNVVAFPGMKR